ncbi:phosphonate C-P lyase system protein PhnG [Acidocella sp.]|uniref:phosphonate C-P lyase system protein PhnG n=1 Tax=Acidocella sp. TaxID=50710 RepID=UPI003CFDD17B
MFDPPFARQDWLSLLSRSDTRSLDRLLSQTPPLPGFSRLRGPEIGMSMVRARAGGGGEAFNLGEMTLARCSIRDEAGRIGHGYAAGRDGALVELIARLDAALQDAALYPAYEREVLLPLAQAERDRRAQNAAKAAASDVQFFTLAAMR